MEHSTPGKTPSKTTCKFAIAADDHDGVNRSRPKRPPPVTPRRFTRFFTPRPRNAVQAVRTSRRALRDITGPALNRRRASQKSQRDLLGEDKDQLTTIEEQPSSQVSRKRKYSVYSATPSLPSSPIKCSGFLSSSQELASRIHVDRDRLWEEEAETDMEIDTDDEEHEPVPTVVPYRTISTSANILSSRITGQRYKKEVQDSQAWQDETANFQSSPTDVHSCASSSGHVVLPFCTASCNTNSLVAIGEEEGGIRLVDSAAGDRDGFSSTYLTMQPHDNAIMDLTFSDDDRLLATASGDQTSQVIDMQTQTSILCLAGHSSSIKRVQFQPGSDNNILATCSRDGSVNIWDLRSRTLDRPSFHLRSNANAAAQHNSGMRYITTANSIRDAHGSAVNKWSQKDLRPRINQVAGRNDFSVTSLSFLGPTRPHMLTTASEAHAVVKLWDVRVTYGGSRRSQATPVSATTEPATHIDHRQYGLTSLALSSDGARLYTLCRDNTIYAYATSHLILGDTPDIATPSTRLSSAEGVGLGPLYGFSHPRLRVSTFYAKLAIRQSQNSNTEMIAAGSSDDCAMLFPTNERYLTKSTQAQTLRPVPLRASFTSGCSFDQSPSLPIYNHGTPLTRGHRKEVTAVTWTSEGGLVSVSDDFSSRVWREDADQARNLRQMGEAEGRRWMCGWADVKSPEYDDE